VNDAEVADPDDCGPARDGATPGEVVALTGRDPVVQTGSGQVVLADFAMDQFAAGNAIGLPGGNARVVLG
jgi:hypothetical protein